MLFSLLLMGCQGLQEQGPAEKAAAYLWSKQAGDGGWHSESHGILKAGQAHTPFVLYMLSRCKEKRPEAFQRGLAFMLNHLDRGGALGLMDSLVLEYPNYASSYALRLFNQYPALEEVADLIGAYLLEQQFAEHRGIGPDHPAYGSWGFGELGLEAGKTGHVDLSHTRKVLQALQEAGLTEEASMQKATDFLDLLQKYPEHRRVAYRTPYDGGFYFSSVIADANKAPLVPASDSLPAYYPSYATATCEGILAKMASGAKSTDETVVHAIQWLQKHPRWDYPEGIAHDLSGQWHRVMFFYHIWVRTEVYDLLDWPGDWRQEVQALVVGHQHEDGSFFNPDGAANKEDDPLIATAMMLDVLLRLEKATSESAQKPR